MRDVPEWITRLAETENLCCNSCKDIFRKKNLISMGIQASSIEPHDDKLCIGMYCSECREITIFELKDMSLVEFAFEILEKETEPDPDSNKRSIDKTTKQDIFRESKKTKKIASTPNKSKITKKYINEAARFLKNVKTHEEFLIAMGMSPEQIDQYSYKKCEEE